MISPFTGGEVELRKELSTVKYKGRTITFEKEFYHCVDTGHEFTDAELDQRNLDRMWEQIRLYETKERVRKEMSCKWYYNGGDCGKGLPGTPCSIVGCVAWEQNPDTK